LNYSGQGLRAVFKKYFPTDADAKAFHRQPQKIANRVYANRMGNGSEASGDGWKYRGRGPLQITGRANYQACSELLNVDLVANPDLAATPAAGFRTAGLFWRRNKLNDLADQQQFKTITLRINGGLNGLDDRLVYYNRAKTALGIGTTRGGAQESEAAPADVPMLFTRGVEELRAEGIDLDAAAPEPGMETADTSAARAGKPKTTAKKTAGKKAAGAKALAKKGTEAKAKKATAKKAAAKRAAAK
jgi:hypothetical protein